MNVDAPYARRRGHRMPIAEHLHGMLIVDPSTAGSFRNRHEPNAFVITQGGELNIGTAATLLSTRCSTHFRVST